MTTPRMPRGLGARGRRLWREVTDAYELGQHEHALLTECCRTADQLDALAAVVTSAGVTLDDGRPHPALVESRQQRLTLARLVASLRLPEDPTDVGADLVRPQRRGAARGTYS